VHNIAHKTTFIRKNRRIKVLANLLCWIHPHPPRYTINGKILSERMIYEATEMKGKLETAYDERKKSQGYAYARGERYGDARERPFDSVVFQ
jgi:hypothetical protein